MKRAFLLIACFIGVGFAADNPHDKRPEEHFCSITLEVMIDPVIATDGHSYERKAITEYFDMCTRLGKPFISPKTNLPLDHHHLTTNQALKALIQDWKPVQPMVVNIFSSVDGDEKQRLLIEQEEALTIKQLKELMVQNHQNLLQHRPLSVQANPIIDKATPQSVDRPMPLSTPEIARGHEDIYRTFLNGVLIYNKGQRDEVRLRIVDLLNPLDGVFDLSRCGDTGNYLSVHTGYRKQKTQYPISSCQIGSFKDRVDWLEKTLNVWKHVDATSHETFRRFLRLDSDTKPLSDKIKASMASIENGKPEVSESSIDIEELLDWWIKGRDVSRFNPLDFYRSHKIYGTNRIEIWFVPRFLIERELSTTARYFQRIMGSWNAYQAPIGIFFSWSDEELGLFYYSTHKSFLEVSNVNLTELIASSGYTIHPSLSRLPQLFGLRKGPRFFDNFTCSFSALK